MSKEIRRDVGLVFIMILLSVAGITAVLFGCRVIDWVVIAGSDLYLFIVLQLAALLSDDECILDRHRWMTGILPRSRAAGLLVVMLVLVAVISGFAGLHVGAEVFSSVKTPLDALYISSFALPLTGDWLWSTRSARPAREQYSVSGRVVSLTHFTNLHFQTPVNA